MLYAQATNDYTSGSKSLYKITSDWNEKDATWEGPWKTQGGDYDGLVQENKSTKARVWDSYDVTKEIRDFHSRKVDNNGFYIRFNDYKPGKLVLYFSSNYKYEQVYRPKLVLTLENVSDEQAPTVELLSLKGGEALKGGRKADIEWKWDDNLTVASYEVFFSSNSGANWELIEKVEGSATQMKWKAPDQRLKNCRVKVVVYDGAGNSATVESERDFEILSDNTSAFNGVANVSKGLAFKQANNKLVLTNLQKSTTVQMLNMKGQQVYKVVTKGSKAYLPLPKVKGVYVLKIKNGAKEFTTSFVNF